MRIKSTYDNQGNVIENAANIYDEDNYGSINFSYYVDINILFNIVSKINQKINDIKKGDKLHNRTQHSF